MKRWGLLFLRVVIGLFFVYAGADKLRDPLGFAENIAEYDVFSMDVSAVIARFLPIAEIVSGLSLATGIAGLGSAFFLGILNALFAVMVGVAYYRGLTVDCGCFTGSGKTSPLHVFFDLALSAACVVIYLCWKTPGEAVPPAP